MWKSEKVLKQVLCLYCMIDLIITRDINSDIRIQLKTSLRENKKEYLTAPGGNQTYDNLLTWHAGISLRGFF